MEKVLQDAKVSYVIDLCNDHRKKTGKNKHFLSRLTNQQAVESRAPVYLNRGLLSSRQFRLLSKKPEHPAAEDVSPDHTRPGSSGHL